MDIYSRMGVQRRRPPYFTVWGQMAVLAYSKQGKKRKNSRKGCAKHRENASFLRIVSVFGDKIDVFA